MPLDIEVTNENLYLLLSGKISHLANMIMQEKNVTLIEAIKQIYNSETYRNLEDERTKMWHLGPVALYEEINRIL